MALLALVLALALVEMLLPAFDSFLQRPIDHLYLADWPLLLLILLVAIAGRPGQRQLSGPGAVGLPARHGPAHQQLRTSGLRPAAHDPGGAAVRGFHRPRYRRHRGIQPDQLRPQHRSRLSTRQYPGCRPCRPRVHRRARKLRAGIAHPAREFSTSPCRAWCLSTPARAWMSIRIPGQPDLILLNQMRDQPGVSPLLRHAAARRSRAVRQRGRRMKSTPGR